jgi:hypothetical protein
MEDIQRLLAIDVSQITLRGIGPMKLPKPTAFIGTYLPNCPAFN